MINKKSIIGAVTLISLSIFLIPSNTTYEAEKAHTEQNTDSQGTSTVELTTPKHKSVLNPQLKPVCACESTGNANNEPTHYEADGQTVLRGKINPRDIGMCQINLDYHEETAKEMGIDLFTESGNIEYANWLFENQGFQPWAWSKHCHNRG